MVVWHCVSDSREFRGCSGLVRLKGTPAIRWLEDWLESFTGSIICTSNATAFLDNLRTHIIDFQDWKLKTFRRVKGNTLTMFVEKYPG